MEPNPEWSAQEIFDNVVAGRINPGYGAPGTSNNCRRCTFAYELSRRGYEVSATKTLKGTGQNEYGLLSAMDASGQRHTAGRHILNVLNGDETALELLERAVLNGSFGVPIKTKRGQVHKDIFETLSQMPNGARGELCVKYSAGNRHSMAWEIVHNKPIIFECQASKMYDSQESFASHASRITNAAVSRLDNVSLNYDFLRKWVKNTW